MFSAAGSMPVTSAPSRAKGSHTSPPPQPMSSTLKSARLAGPLASRPNLPAELVADIGEAQRVDAVERPEGTALVPPLPGEPREPCDFLGVERPRRI